jgi:galactoside O-acetyltransferase
MHKINSFYSDSELHRLGFRRIGKNVSISKKASLYGIEKMAIGDHVRIDDFCILSGTITIGSYVHISAFAALYGAAGIVIEDFSGLSPRATVLSVSDDFSGDAMIGPLLPDVYTNVKKGAVSIGTFVQIGAGSVIMPGISIPKGVAVGALSLVNKDPDSWTIIAGIPAKAIRKRSKNLLKKYDAFKKTKRL